jgi:FKBP-type peptidyl-prolyl cis-trans isomerase FkpA/FKBP-type peptidyl-prolyl cis-trans isomerase FklB
MKKINVFVIIIVAIGMVATSCGQGYKKNVSLKTDVDSMFYAIGVANGAQWREGIKTIPGTDGKENHDALIAGLAAALKDDVSLLKMTPENAQMFLQTYFETASIKEAQKTKTEGEAFLASNKTKQGVITTLSGLQYKVITEGAGRRPTPEDVVIVHYIGKLIDDTVFESSVERGEPATFPLSGLIQGWIEGIQIMPVGSKYIFWIPSELAYGEYGSPPAIKPNSTLMFELELLGIKEQ